MNFYAKLYYYYNLGLIKILRLIIFILLLLFSTLVFSISITPNFFITIFILYLIFEIYFHFKISKLTPRVLVKENNNEPLRSFSLQSLSLLLTHKNSQDIIKRILNKPQVNFILYKSDIVKKDLKIINIDKDLLIQKSFELVKQNNGKFVTVMDLFVAYLLLSENETKTIFNINLKEKDLQNILSWAKTEFPMEEYSKQKFVFWGEGFAEDWIYGWTIETKKYMLDLTSELIDRTKNAVGRDLEYKQLLEGLSQNQSTILVGETGSGKTAIIENLARESFNGVLKGNLFHQRVFQLMVDAFMAGAKTQGELEERLDAIIAEVSHSGNIIIFIPNFENILGSTDFNLNISGSLLPYIQKRKIRIIGSLTPGAYKKFVQPLPSFLENFSVINFPNLDKETVLKILFEKVPFIEKRSKVIITYEAILESYNFAANYVKEKVMPGAAVVLLEDSANSVSLRRKKIVEGEDIREQIKKKTHIEVGKPQVKEKELLLNLETEIHKRVIGQNEAVKAVSEALRRLRVGLEVRQKPISFLFLGPTGVGKTETAKSLAHVYFGEENKMLRFDMSEFSGLDGEKRLLGSAPGEGEEKGQLTEKVYDNPNSLILLDEFEKADAKILDLFLQVLDDGRLTDNKGKTVSFVNSLIIATSNGASEYIREKIGKGTKVDEVFHKNLLEFLQTKGIFKPELLNRFDGIIIFKPLEKQEIEKIINLNLAHLTSVLKEKDIEVSFDERVVGKIVEEGFDNDFGARPIKRFIADKIEDLIAQKMLKDEIKRGDKILVEVDSSGFITV